MPGGERGDFLDGVQKPGARLAVHGRDMGDSRIGSKRFFNDRRIERKRFLKGKGLAVAAHARHDFGDPRTIGAVDGDKHLPLPRQKRAEHGFNAEGAASLKRHASVRFPTSGKLQEPVPHPLRERDEITIPRAPVAKHLFLRIRRSRDRAWREQ